KFLIVVVLWTPSSHFDDAFHVNCAASGAPARASRASSNACTLTPLSTTLVIALPLSLRNLIFLNENQTIPVGGPAEQPPPALPTSAPAPGSVGMVETQDLHLPNPVQLDSA